MNPRQNVPMKTGATPLSYDALRSAIIALPMADSPGAVLKRKGCRPGWRLISKESFEGNYSDESFEILLRLEENEKNRKQNVTLYSVRIRPPSKLAKHTQHATFNSKHKDKNGYRLQTHFSRAVHQPRVSLEAKLSTAKGFPCWTNGSIYLGDGTPSEILKRFLAATSLIAELKDFDARSRNRVGAKTGGFDASDLFGADEFLEGQSGQMKCKRRVRSIKLRNLAIKHYKQQSSDGRLHCFVDEWVPGIPVRGNIVQIHHDEALAGYPKEGKKLTFTEAIKFLFPLCPNCHRLLESKPGGGRYSISELRSRLVSGGNSQ